jgi:hypothetical protein
MKVFERIHRPMQVLENVVQRDLMEKIGIVAGARHSPWAHVVAAGRGSSRSGLVRFEPEYFIAEKTRGGEPFAVSATHVQKTGRRVRRQVPDEMIGPPGRHRRNERERPSEVSPSVQ